MAAANLPEYVENNYFVALHFIQSLSLEQENISVGLTSNFQNWMVLHRTMVLAGCLVSPNFVLLTF